MDDLLFDAILGETETPQRKQTPREVKRTTVSDNKDIESDLVDAAELGYNVYALHGNPNPLQLMRILASVDNAFLSEKKRGPTETYYLSHLADIFF